MVTSSPMIACVNSTASGVGASRTGASAAQISKSSPSTKRSASTLPCRDFAAMSLRAGVRRESSIAFAQQLEDRACGLAFATLGTARFGLRRPGEDVDMQPALGMLDEALQEQRAGDRAC